MDDAAGAAPTRRRRAELRDLLLQAGRDILEEEGLDVGAGDLTFKRVFDHLERTTGVRLTNASVIGRVWENQDDYRTDVLVAIARTADAGGELDRTVDALVPVLEALDRSTPQARLAALGDVARIGGEVGMRARLDTREWSLWVGVWVLALTTPPTGRRSAIRTALLDGLEAVTDLWEQVFTALSAHLGTRLRSPRTMRQFAVLVSAMVEGSALRQGGDPELELFDRATGPDGSAQQWTLFGVCLEALALQFFEIDPDWVGPGPAA